MINCDNQLRRAVRCCRRGFLVLAVFSLAVNLLALTAPLFMLQVYDRVLNSRSLETLGMLAMVAIMALAVMAFLEAMRSVLLAKLSTWLDQRLSSDLISTGVRQALEQSGPVSLQSLLDLATVRGFLTGPGILPLLDAPWVPIFLAVIFVLHPFLGLIATAGAIMLLVLAVANELLTRSPLEHATAALNQGRAKATAAVRNADVLNAMGMAPAFLARWRETNRASHDLQMKAGNRSAATSSLAKFGRHGLQIAMLAAGAWLVILGELTPGGMIAASIIMGRALAPVDQAMSFWRGLIKARQAYNDLAVTLAGSRDPAPLVLPRPSGAVSVAGLSFRHAGRQTVTLRALNFHLDPGEMVGVIGPSASGKTTLARLLVGNLEPSLGHMRLDGADMWSWPSDDLGRHVGYLPQAVELFEGTIAENIARLATPDRDKVLRASRQAGVDDMILSLPDGYGTRLSERGVELSSGQRQRIGLARALYGSPCLVVLDEPNANLDTDGQTALVHAFEAMKRNRQTTIIVAHQPSILRLADKLIVLHHGRMVDYGERAEVMGRLTREAGHPSSHVVKRIEGA